MSGSFPSPAFNIATIFSQPVATTDAANKAYVDATSGGSGGPFLPLSGGTVSGGAFLNGGGGRAGNWAESGTFTGGTYNSATIGGTWAGNPTFSGNITHQGTSALNGATTIGTNTASANLILNGPNLSSRIVRWTTAGSTRWQLQATSTAESTGNVGSDLAIFGYTDAGSSPGPIEYFTRSTGSVTWDLNNVWPNAVYRMNRPFFPQSVLAQTLARVMVSGQTTGTTSVNPLGIAQNIAWSGVLDTGQPTLNSIITNDTIAVSQGIPTLTQLQMTHNYNAGAQSARTQCIMLINKNAASADGQDGGIANLGCFAHYDVGDSTNPASPIGRVSCVNMDGRIGGAGGIAAISFIIQENDIRLFAGNTVNTKINLNLHNAIGDAAHGTYDDIALAFSSTPLINPGTGGCQTMIGIGRNGTLFPWDPLMANTAVMQARPMIFGNSPNAVTCAVTYGIDFSGLNFTSHAWRSTGFWIDKAGQVPVLGPAAITHSNTGTKIAVPNVREVSATVAVGGTGYKVNDVVTDAIGGLWTVTAAPGGVVTTVSLLRTGYASPAPTNPVATLFGGGAGLTLNITTAATGALNLGDTGQSIGFLGATAITRPTVTGSRGANAALASLLTALATYGLVVDSSS